MQMFLSLIEISFERRTFLCVGRISTTTFHFDMKNFTKCLHVIAIDLTIIQKKTFEISYNNNA